MLIFGAFQILLSQIPDFDRLWFLSIVAAVMSFSYSSIGLGLAIGKTRTSTAPPPPSLLVLSFPPSHSYRHSFIVYVVQDTMEMAMHL